MEKQKKKNRNKSNVKYHGNTFTREQKLVSTVWYHERTYTGMTFDQLCQNFLTRFNVQYPSIRTLHRWDKRLFEEGGEIETKKIKAINFNRWVYIPYIKESLIRNPDMTAIARSQFLGMSTSTLRRILKKDLKEFHSAILTKIKKENVTTTTNDTENNHETSYIKDIESKDEGNSLVKSK